MILEILGHAGLPPSASSALVEMLSAAAADGKGIQTIESALERLAGWLKSGGEAEAIVPAVSHADDGGVDRLFRHLVPDVTGRRSGHEIINRLRSKWDLDHSLSQILGRVRDQFHGLAELRGPAPAVLERLNQNFAALAPRSIADLGALVKQLGQHGVESSRVELDLGFGRGIGFYTQMIFELVVATPGGPVEVCGGGRYDGLARVLGSDRDDRGVGFAFGLERLVETAPHAARRGARLESRRDNGNSADEYRTDRPHPAGDPLQGAPLRWDHRALEDGRLQGPAGQRPAVRGDDRRSSAGSTSSSCGRPTS